MTDRQEKRETKTNTDSQNTTQKTKDYTTRTLQNTFVEYIV